MVTHKRKKNTRQRAGTTHGWGARKKHRGSGNRGGVGNAGSGKRAHCKKPSYWSDKTYFGMHGFKMKGVTVENFCINVADLKALSEKAGTKRLNLADYGINKLLGSGHVDEAFDITVDYASSGAVEKIMEAKGSVNLSKSSEEAEE